MALLLNVINDQMNVSEITVTLVKINCKNLSFQNVHSRYNYAVNLRKELAEPAVIVSLLNGTVMQGSKGAVGNVTLPAGKLEALLLSRSYC